MVTIRMDMGRVRGVLVVLEVEGPERLLSTERLFSALFGLRVQVVHAVASHRDGRAAHRLELCEFDGGVLTPRRRRAITSELSRFLGSLVPMMPPRAARDDENLPPSRAA